MKTTIAAATLLIALSAMAPATFAQSPQDAEIVGYHQLCDKGDRRACVRFGMMIEHRRDMHAQWRRTHPEFFWFEH